MLGQDKPSQPAEAKDFRDDRRLWPALSVSCLAASGLIQLVLLGNYASGTDEFARCLLFLTIITAGTVPARQGIDRLVTRWYREHALQDESGFLRIVTDRARALGSLVFLTSLSIFAAARVAGLGAEWSVGIGGALILALEPCRVATSEASRLTNGHRRAFLVGEPLRRVTSVALLAAVAFAGRPLTVAILVGVSACASVLSAVLGLAACRRPTPSANRPRLEDWAIGLRISIASGVGVLLSNIDVWVVAFFYPLEDVAIYALASRSVGMASFMAQGAAMIQSREVGLGGVQGWKSGATRSNVIAIQRKVLTAMLAASFTSLAFGDMVFTHVLGVEEGTQATAGVAAVLLFGLGLLTTSSADELALYAFNGERHVLVASATALAFSTTGAVAFSILGMPVVTVAIAAASGMAVRSALVQRQTTAMQAISSNPLSPTGGRRLA